MPRFRTSLKQRRRKGRSRTKKGYSHGKIPRAFPPSEAKMTLTSAQTVPLNQANINNDSNWQRVVIGNKLNMSDWVIYDQEDSAGTATYLRTLVAADFRNLETFSQFYSTALVTGFKWRVSFLRDSIANDDRLPNLTTYVYEQRVNTSFPLTSGITPIPALTDAVYNKNNHDKLRTYLDTHRQVSHTTSRRKSKTDMVQQNSFNGYNNFMTDREGGKKFGDPRMLTIANHPDSPDELIRHSVTALLTHHRGFNKQTTLLTCNNRSVASTVGNDTHMGFSRAHFEISFDVTFINRIPEAIPVEAP